MIFFYKIAEEIGLLVAKKRDSQEICFIPDHDYAAFIKENTDTKILPGNFVSTDGTILGRHKGIIYYTIGQRKGLNLSLLPSNFLAIKNSKYSYHIVPLFFIFFNNFMKFCYIFILSILKILQPVRFVKK